ncbi:uncharacterized protein [Branchiostoma lanceolatum]|uniref:uncharacterized protein n=1 Tax=Branchiostoma lanceolatum TaxID=7740 RepID=UPI00345511E2
MINQSDTVLSQSPTGFTEEVELTVLLQTVVLAILSQLILMTIQYLLQERAQIPKSIPAETINITTVHGDGSIVVSTGSGSTLNLPTCPHGVLTENHTAGRQEHTVTHRKPSRNPKLHGLQLLPLIGKPTRQNTKTLVTCHKFIDNLTKLSAEGKMSKCSIIIAKLMTTKTDPDFQVSLHIAASLNAICDGDFVKANRLLSGAEMYLPGTKYEAEHRIMWSCMKSVAMLRVGNYNMGIILAKEGLPLIDMVAPGCLTAWMLFNHGWLMTEIAASQADAEDRKFLLVKAEKDYQQAIEHAENEHPKQMLHSQSRVPRFAKIGLALLYLGCKESVNNCRLEISVDISSDDLRKAKNMIAALDKEGTACNLSKFFLIMAKTCLQYRLGKYQEAYELAQKAKVFATNHSFEGFLNYADSTVQYLQHYV